MLTPVQKGMVSTALKWLVGGLLVAFMAVMTLFYRSEAQDAQQRLQEVTQQYTDALEQHENFVVEQELLQSILAAGKVQKDISKVKTDEAIRKQAAEGTPVRVTGVSLDLLQQRSREVREAAIGVKH